MKRLGTVLIFKPEVTEEEAGRALHSLAFLLDTPDTINKPIPELRAALEASDTVLYQPDEWAEVEFSHSDLIYEFDDDLGSPVWYIP